MDGTPRLRSAFPATPPRNPRDRPPAPFGGGSSNVQRQPLPQVPTLKAQPTTAPATEPLISEALIDAPSQRLYAVAFWIALWTWRIYDFAGLRELEEQSLWLFMKWVAIDGVFLFGLPGLRIPWLEWSTATMTLIFLAHAFIDGMLMFRIPVPIGAGLAVLWRGFWGAYETAVNEYNVNPDTVMFNESLILGRQVIHVLPEGSAVLNPGREFYCLDDSRTQVKLPITINATNPISMDILRIDLETQANETLQISKSQIKTMHKEASRLLSYNENPNEPTTLYYTVKRPGLYALAKVLDESNLEVSRKKMAHTVVVPCPRAVIISPDSDKCRGDYSEVSFMVTGTPPMKVKYRKIQNKNVQEATFENIQPDKFESPMVKQDQSSLVVPAKMSTEWARPRSVSVPLDEGLSVAGRWMYAIDEITDAFGNIISYSVASQHDAQGRRGTQTQSRYQVITVHERPRVQLNGCTAQKPLKVAKGRSARLPIQFSSTGKSELREIMYDLKYQFTPQDQVAGDDKHGMAPQLGTFSSINSTKIPSITVPGLYTLTGVSAGPCEGEVLEPASCLLQNPPEPQLSITEEAIYDKCAGSPIGLRVDFDLIGTPPFDVRYRMISSTEHRFQETVSGLRKQIELTPTHAGHYTYIFDSISDAVYKDVPLKGLKLRQSVKPSASAKFVGQNKQVSCIDQTASVDVDLSGEAPFTLEYELVHNGKRTKFTKTNVTGSRITIDTPTLDKGGDYTLALVSITDALSCKEFLTGESRIAVRHLKPKASFGQIDVRRIVDRLENSKVQLPLRLTGEGPWTVKYADNAGAQRTIQVRSPNDRITVDSSGLYELLEVSDNVCPGVIDESAKEFVVNWIPRPEMRISTTDVKKRDGNRIWKEDVCEGDEDTINVLFKGATPFRSFYEQHIKLESGAVAPKAKELRAAQDIAPLRMDTSQAGLYEYRFTKLTDNNYPDHAAQHFTPLTIYQHVNARPSAVFTSPGKTYSFCSVESEGEEVIPIKLRGLPPFELEVEIKHLSSTKPELVHYHDIQTKSHSIRIPHSRLQLGKSTVSLRRVSDGRGCGRTLDSTTPRVQISVHDAPTITPLETQADYCVGDRINFGLSGVTPFTIFYTFEGVQRKATVSSGNAFRRFAEKPGEFTIVGLQDSASTCKLTTNIPKQIHGMPSVRVSKGKDSYVDIHEGGEAEITFDFGGTPPFEFTYTRSSNTEKGGKQGTILDMRSEVSEEKSMKIWASEAGTYEVVAIKDAHCAYAKPGIKFESEKKRRLTY